MYELPLTFLIGDTCKQLRDLCGDMESEKVGEFAVLFIICAFIDLDFLFMEIKRKLAYELSTRKR